MTTKITEETGGTPAACDLTPAACDLTPAACDLTPADLAAQRGRWERLAGRALTERVRTADGLRLAFRPEPGVEEELRALVAVENECCPWAAWTVEASTRRVVLDARSTGTGTAVLHSMFTDLRPGPDSEL
jgi:hypothetical protein